uniref:Regulatory protein zeste n=1 Tax=Timema shepardi TaxID=629360 RepID=A0A7R9G864_TIMSH|nr:unnamed protein product [Timema shepardi]
MKYIYIYIYFRTIVAKKNAWEQITRIFKSSGNLQKTLVHLRKHWDIVKSRRKRKLVEETVELMSTGRGPYNSHKPSCSKAEVVAPPL